MRAAMSIASTVRTAAHRSFLFHPESIIASSSRATFSSTSSPRADEPSWPPKPAPARAADLSRSTTTTTTLLDESPSGGQARPTTTQQQQQEYFAIHPDEPSQVYPHRTRGGQPFNPSGSATSTGTSAGSPFASALRSPSPASAPAPTFLSSPRREPARPVRPGGSMLTANPRYAPLTNQLDDPTITHELHVHVTRNNIHLTFLDSMGKLGPTVSGGTDKTFKGVGRSTYEAAHQAMLKVMDRILDYSEKMGDSKIRIRLAFNGLIGYGREAVSAAIVGPTGDNFRHLIGRVEDRTASKIGGNRARKPRRI